MSALTSSPSPTVSPRSPFYVQSHRRLAPSCQSSRLSPSTPRRAFAVSPALRQLQAKQEGESGGQTAILLRYVDAGTQYSPEGSPPTTTRATKVAGVVTAERGDGLAGSAAKKRKESTRSESPPAQSMKSGSASSSGHISSAGPPSRGPAEPALRESPSTSTTSYALSNATDATSTSLPSRSAASEPLEVRPTDEHTVVSKRARQDDVLSPRVMPLRYETCAPKDLGILISNMLLELIRLNDKIPLRDGRLTRFHSRAPPGISVSDYLQRLIQHATLSPPILLSMVYYIDRLCGLYPAFTINSLTVHRFLITAATVAAKGLSDSFWTNPTYARIGGIPHTELATLELEFLMKVQWKIVPKPEVLEDYYRSLVERTPGFVLDGQSEETSSFGSTDKDDEDVKVENLPIEEPT